MQIKCQIEAYFNVPDHMTPNEFISLLKNTISLEAVKYSHEAYATDWQIESDNNEWDDYIGD